MEVRFFRDQDRELWDAYVRTAPLTNFFHLSGWDDVWSRTMGCQTCHLLAIDGGQVVGVLPLIHIKSRLAGHYITSLPGGLCADGEDAAGVLLHRAKDLVRQLGASYLILRDGLRRWELPDLITNDDQCTFWIDVSDGVDGARSRMRRSTRSRIRKGMRAGAETGIDRHSFAEFYPIYTEAMRERGTPSPGRAFFEAALERFAGDLVLATVSRSDAVLGGGLVAPMRDTLFCTWSGLPRAHYDFSTSYLLYWGAVDYAAQLGRAKVDMGRCQRGSGSYQFKVRWGGEEKTLYQQYFLNGIEHPPRVGAALHESAKNRLFFNLWQRLPIWVAEAVGPQLRKRMPFG